MPQESVVDALRTTHCALRPGGRLLVLQPQAQAHRDLLAHVDGETLPAGRLLRTPRTYEDLLASERSLGSVTSMGLLGRSWRVQFAVNEHFDTPQRWLACLERNGDGVLDGDLDLINRALALMPHDRAHLIAREPFQAICLDRRLDLALASA